MVLSISNFAGSLNEKAELDKLFNIRNTALELCYTIAGYKNSSRETRNYIYDNVRDALMSVEFCREEEQS